MSGRRWDRAAFVASAFHRAMRRSAGGAAGRGYCEGRVKVEGRAGRRHNAASWRLYFFGSACSWQDIQQLIRFPLYYEVTLSCVLLHSHVRRSCTSKPCKSTSEWHHDGGTP